MKAAAFLLHLLAHTQCLITGNPLLQGARQLPRRQAGKAWLWHGMTGLCEVVDILMTSKWFGIKELASVRHNAVELLAR
jgi:hypothetical protein